MRALALLLILANVCYFFWAHYVDVPEASPLASAVPDNKRPPRLVLATERPAQDTQQQTISELSCISVGPLASVEELQQLKTRLESAGFTGTPRSEQGEVFVGYWVSLQGFATRADAEQSLKRLATAGISDAYILPDSEPAIALSLGLFSDPRRAEQRRDAIAKLGFEPQLQNRTRMGESQWLDVALQEPGQLIDPALLQPETGGIVRLETRACPADSASAAAVSEQSSSQATSQSSSLASR